MRGLVATGLLLAATACGESNEPSVSQEDHVSLTLRFEARVGELPFSCGQQLDALGTSGVEAEPMDLRLYVHDVRLLRDGGEPAPFSFEADGVWQSDTVALLDFEDASGRCSEGTEETNTLLRGRAPPGDYTGVVFRIGVPTAQNHLDLSTAAPPLNVPDLYWSWQGGYKYLKAELYTEGHHDGYLLHLGAQGCGGSPASGVFDCVAENLAEITLKGDISAPVTLGVVALFAGVDLAAQPDMQTDLVPGCMSGLGDPECAPLLAAFGLPSGEQKVFSLP